MTFCDATVLIGSGIGHGFLELMKRIMFVMNRTDRYRLLALLELARIYPESTAAADIARARGIPSAYLSRLLAELARAGLVTSRRGAGGGVALARDPCGVPIGAVLDHDTSSPTSTPPLDRLERRLADAMASALEGLTIADLREWELQTHDVTDYAI